MSKYRYLLLSLSMGLLPLCGFGQIEIIVGEYSQFNKQTGPDTLVGFGDHTNFEFGGNYTSYLTVEGSETVSNLTATGPSYPSGAPIPFDEDLYEILGEYATAAEMTTAFMPGTYTITGNGSISGAFTETLVMPAYSPATPLKVTNYTELQSFNPAGTVTIEWEEFTEGQGPGPNLGYGGVIGIEIYGFNEFGGYEVYDSDQDTPEGAFGLLPTQTSLTLPANTFNADDFYNVNIFFARIDSFNDAATLGDALIAVVTGYEVEVDIVQEGKNVDPTWAGYPIGAEGWVDTTPWLGFLNVAQAPWIWSATLNKWLYIDEGAVTQGGGWVYITN
jgi:hypothetical protein